MMEPESFLAQSGINPNTIPLQGPVHTYIHKNGQLSIAYTPAGLFLTGVRKLQNLEQTYLDSERTCTKTQHKAELSIHTGTLQL